jgi:glycosyltransferase involved in cell wall biosynthesis
MKPQLAIVVPARNEAMNLPKLLTSLSRQDYPHLRHTKVFVADANSTDTTITVANAFGGLFEVTVITGGLPAVGRNAGARLADTRYVLFLDADVELTDRTMLRRAMAAMEERQLYCLTTSIGCTLGSFMDDVLFAGSNLCQRLGSWIRPFGTGMFLLFDRAEFERLGGFNEQALFAEDYLLTQKVAIHRFGILRGKIYTSNRRFQKMGHMHVARMFFRTMCNSFNESYYLQDQNYWKSGYKEAGQKAS